MRRSGGSVRSALVLAVAALPACSVLVDASDVPIRCEGDAGCPAGQRCIEGVCRDGGDGPCLPEGDEICDGRDNDCDNEVDEGHDSDGDGATWCGGGVPSERDCDDDDPRRYPDADEVCDGADNDCDDEIDEGSCPPGEACNPFEAVCEPFDCREHGCPLEEGGCNEETGVCDAPDCRDDGPPCVEVFELCDPRTGRCVSREGTLGSPCRSHVECLSEFCLHANVARLDLDGSVCSQLCCVNGDCPNGFVCWTSGSGTSACVARDVVGLPPDGAGLGAACTRGADCASGLCADGSCGAPCCTDGDCAGNACAMVQALGRPEPSFVLACRDAAGGDFNDFCYTPGDCASVLCLDGGCTMGCCTSPQCGNGFVCGYASTPDTNDHFRVCIFREGLFGGGVGTGQVGDDCTLNQDCRSTVCSGRTCTDACCGDGDCPRGFACRPRTFGEGFASYCERI